MNNKCRTCNIEIKDFDDAKTYRLHRYCKDHLPSELKCYCGRVVSRVGAKTCKRHWKTPKRAIHQCLGTTVSGKRCGNFLRKRDSYCGKCFSSMKNKPLKSKDYKKYVASSAWTKKSKRARKNFGDRCRICNRTGIIHTHHRTYERLGVERPEDLTPLCETCHDRFHSEFEYDKQSHTFIPNH